MAISNELRRRIEALAGQLCDEAGEVDESQGDCSPGCGGESGAGAERRPTRGGCCSAGRATVERGRRIDLPGVRPEGLLPRRAQAGVDHAPRPDDDRRTGVLLPVVPAGFFSR
jgi:hypothetical protein